MDTAARHSIFAGFQAAVPPAQLHIAVEERWRGPIGCRIGILLGNQGCRGPCNRGNPWCQGLAKRKIGQTISYCINYSDWPTTCIIDPLASGVRPCNRVSLIHFLPSLLSLSFDPSNCCRVCSESRHQFFCPVRLKFPCWFQSAACSLFVQFKVM